MPTRLLKTSAFRIGLLYLGLLGTTVSALLGFVYWSTTNLIDRQTRWVIEEEGRQLADEYRDEGLDRLITVVDERSGPTGNSLYVYLLVGPTGERLAGNLSAWPAPSNATGAWIEMPLRSAEQPRARPDVLLGRVFDLPRGVRLFVGHDADERLRFREIMLGALGWSVIPALLLGLPGGLLIGRYSLRRVDGVRVTAREIIDGDLTRRVPLSGTGDEFDRLAETINEMLDQIDALMGGMRAVTDSLAHDLRSPMTRAKNVIEKALRTDADGAACRQALEQTNAELEAILRTFEALINIARAETGLNRLGFAPVNLTALMEAMMEVYQPIAEDAGLGLDGDIAPMEIPAGHRDLLGQAIANLLDNAIKYTKPGGKVRVRVGCAAGHAILVVEDTGPGIPPQDRARVLERFVRLDDADGRPGSGLGLSLVAAVAKLHGVTLTLEDNEPGLRVTLRFP